MNTDNIKSLAISDSGFIFDPVSGHSYTINETGLTLLRMLKTDKEIAEIIQDFLVEYDVSEDELDLDIQEFIQTLKSYYLITE
jgi:hypothetical protein